ncbi:MAG TPA: phosphoribosylglycinamide formyltransferase [Candidatus Eisenbacteria bacterium]|nr:phosphoribosylglycinamide formyltransferase [Candidatus Eisenbacteria bacterium]
MRLAVFCSGYGSNFQALADAVRRRKLRAEIVLLVSDNPASFAVRRAVRAGIPVCLISPKLFESRAEWERLIVRVLRSQGVDLVVLAGFMRILTPYFIGAYRGKIVNIHPSYLPAFKGAHAIRDAFEAGVRETGVTVHHVTNELDSGAVILQKKVKVRRGDTLASLEKRIHAVEHRLYPAAIRKLLSKRAR